MQKKPVKVYLTAPHRYLLRKIAETEEISRSEVLRIAFLEYVSARIKAGKGVKIEPWMSEQ